MATFARRCSLSSSSSSQLPSPQGPRPPPPAHKSLGSAKPAEWAAHPGSPLVQSVPLCPLGPREPGLARAAPLPRVRRSETKSAGQPRALAAIQGGERRGKQRAGEGRGGEPPAQRQRRAPHRLAPRTLARSRDARAADWPHHPGHLVQEVSPERQRDGGGPGTAGVGGGGRQGRMPWRRRASYSASQRRLGGGGGVPAAVSPGGSRWQDQGLPVSGEMALGGEDAEDRNWHYRPELQLGASPPWVPRRREVAAVRRRLELVSLS